ncbi:MAG: hypothetical protein CMD33_03655 [Flavobacteriales bacterium]|nr:hypothetical protein [Flavobacteriales bacterium]
MAYADAVRLEEGQVRIMMMLEVFLGATGACDFMMRRRVCTHVHMQYPTWCKEIDSRVLRPLHDCPSCPWRIHSWYTGKRWGQVEAAPRQNVPCIASKDDLHQAAADFEFTIGIIAPNETHIRQAIRNFHGHVDCSLHQVCFVHGWDTIMNDVSLVHMKVGGVHFKLYRGNVAIVNCHPVFNNWWAYDQIEEERIMGDVMRTIFQAMKRSYVWPKGDMYRRTFTVKRAELLKLQTYDNFPHALNHFSDGPPAKKRRC